MATRALKKLTKKDNLKELEEINKKLRNSSEDESDDPVEKKHVPNKFNLVIKKILSQLSVNSDFNN